MVNEFNGKHEVASLEGLSQKSRDASDGKAKSLEKVYLQKVEGMPAERQGQKAGHKKQNFRGEVTGRTGIDDEIMELEDELRSDLDSSQE